LHVLKRWAAWPQGIRWLAGSIAAVVLALVVAWVLFVPAADWLATHDVGHVTGALQQTARDDARGRLLTLGAGLFAAGALIFTALNFNLLRRNSQRADQWQRRTYELTEQGQVTDRYTKAIEQLGSATVDVTIGGIYALERIARDSPRDHPTVMEVLAACVREHSREPLIRSAPVVDTPEPITRPDIQAAVTVIGRRNAAHDLRRIDLRGVYLPLADLYEANLTGADLTGADLTGANLAYTDLAPAGRTHAKPTGADLAYTDLAPAYLTRASLTLTKPTPAKLAHANLTGADLYEADLTRADLTGANLTGAKLTGAKLTRAYLTSANLTRTNLIAAKLTRANLTGADLTGANLRGADLTGANLTRANLADVDLSLADLTGADLTDANLTGTDLTDAKLTVAILIGTRWPGNVPVPEGWKLDTRSGLLEETAGTDSGPTEAD
jgi:uncharacterized protein YjbI with pentapeptide repeats